MDRDVEDLDDIGCHKFQGLVDEETWISSGYPFRHKTILH